MILLHIISKKGNNKSRKFDISIRMELFMFEDLFDKKNDSEKKCESTYKERPDIETTQLTSENIRSILVKNSDVVFREILICGNENRAVTLIYVDGMIDSKTVADTVIRPLMLDSKLCEAQSEKETISLIEYGYVHFPAQKTRKKIKEAISDIMTGSCALIFNEEKAALTFETKGFQQRSISEPTEENIVKGPKDVFVENIRVNTATVRRKIHTPDLVIEQTIVGKQTLTPVEIVYIEGITNKGLVKEIKARLDSIDIDGVIESGFIEEFIIDSKFSVFPQVTATERPDVFASNILDGRVGIIIDGIPIAYTMPGVIYQFLRTPDDYSQNYLASSILRLLRYTLMFVTVFLPAFYISVTTFHHEMIPSELALSIAASKEGVPYPTFVEVIAFLIAFEILLESGLRLPKNIGQAVSIVGALVVGDAAVSAGFISPAVVVVIAITAISGFTMPNQDFANALRLWRFIMAILASIIGLVGMTFGGIFMLFSLAAMETFGVPYLSPFVSGDGKGMDDTLIRPPVSFLKYRPFSLKTNNKRRQK